MKLSVNNLSAFKGNRQIAMLTAYNCPIARYLEQIGIPVILVGDTLAMVEMGHSNTRSVTVEQMAYHISAVRRGAPNTHIIGDLPYLSYETQEDAITHSRLLIEAGADSIKLEGPKYEIISSLREEGIEVVGHTGLTPQTAKNFKKVGRSEADSERILAEAIGISNAGAFMLILEHIPDELGKKIRDSIDPVVIGIGAGPDCDGQVLVTNDALGLGDYWPPFSKQYTYLGKIITEALSEFKEDVESKNWMPNKS